MPAPGEPDLLPSEMSQLFRIFLQNAWIVSSGGDYGEAESLFDKYCQLLHRLKPLERNLVLTLTSDFLKCPSSDYRRLIRTAASTVPPPLYVDAQEVYIVPLVAPRDRGRTKSSQSVAYTANNIAPDLPLLARRFRQPVPGDMWQLKVSRPKRSNSLIVFFDDFVGTGETAKEAFEAYHREIAVAGEKAILVVLVAQEAGLHEVARAGFHVFTAISRRKGISESTMIQDIPIAKQLMSDIETRMKIDAKECFGYDQTEALVSMDRTPNNTFPVFWKCAATDDGKWPAPFPRQR